MVRPVATRIPEALMKTTSTEPFRKCAMIWVIELLMTHWPERCRCLDTLKTFVKRRFKMITPISHNKNEKADALTKLSLNMPDINSTNYIELPEVFSVIKSHVISEWQKIYDNDFKGQHCKCICPEVNINIKFADLNSRKEVQISRLRLGKVNLNERLLLIKNMNMVFVAYAKSEKILTICCWSGIRKISRAY